MTDTYQVTADCVYATVDTGAGRIKTLVYRNGFVPADAPELKHLLDNKMVAKVGGDPVEDERPPAPLVGDGDKRAGSSVLPPPPMGGPGSGRDAWAAYASTNGVTVTDDMKSREDVVAALKAAGVPVERAE